MNFKSKFLYLASSFNLLIGQEIIPFDVSNINDLVVETDKDNIGISTNKIIKNI